MDLTGGGNEGQTVEGVRTGREGICTPVVIEARVIATVAALSLPMREATASLSTKMDRSVREFANTRIHQE